MMLDDYNKNLLTADEQQFVLNCFKTYKHDNKTLLSQLEYEQVNNDLLKSLADIQSKTAEDQVFSFAPCATDIIERLFKQYVDDDTVVLTTKQEHPKVDRILKKQKNVIYVFDDCKFNIDVFQLANIVSQYKRAFIYVIGTTCSIGKRVDQSQLKAIKHVLSQAHVSSIFVLDAVQELFMLQRDYSMFDYVIGTAHAIVPKYDCGMVISRNEPYCRDVTGVALQFSKLLKLVLARRQYLSKFSSQLNDRFKVFIDKFNLISNYSSGHLYSIGDMKGTLLPIIPESQRLFKETGSNKSVKNVLFRGCWSIFDPISDAIGVDNDCNFANAFSTVTKFLAQL